MKGQTIEATVVFQKLFASKAKIRKLEGGSRSSKTWSIIQWMVIYCQANKGKSITITRSNLTWLKATVIKDFKEILELYRIPIHPEINIRRPEQVYEVLGNEFSFIGAEEKQKLFGRKQDIFWMNEAMEFSLDEFDQLEMRTSEVGLLDYNPTFLDHWVYDLEKRPDVELIHSTILDNPFAPPEVVKKVKSYEPTDENVKVGTANQYNWNVYGLGIRDVIRGLIFPLWHKFKDFPVCEWIVYGLDFGYTQNPTTLVKVGKKGNGLYLQELIYETGMMNNHIAARFETLGLQKRSQQIIADSAEPKSIDEIYTAGWNIHPAKKGPDSVIFGIQIMQQYKLFIHEESKNLQKEIKNYKFAEDKEGKALNNPIKELDHCIDAIRYVCLIKLGRKPKELIIA